MPPPERQRHHLNNLICEEFVAILLLICTGLDQVIFLEEWELFQRLHTFWRSYIRVACDTMGGFYHDFASFFRQYKVDKCFSYISISSAFDQANRADRPAGIIVNRAVDLLSFALTRFWSETKLTQIRYSPAPVFCAGVNPEGVNCATWPFSAFK